MLYKWVPQELTENREIVIVFYATTMNHFSIRLQCVMKSELYMATSNNQLNGWTKKKLQSTSQRKFAPKKKAMVTVWWFAVHQAHYSFLNPGKTIISEKYAQQINEMH